MLTITKEMLYSRRNELFQLMEDTYKDMEILWSENKEDEAVALETQWRGMYNEYNELGSQLATNSY